MPITYPVPYPGTYDAGPVPVPQASYSDFEDGTLQGWSNNTNCTPTNESGISVPPGIHGLLMSSIAAGDMSVHTAQFTVLPVRSYTMSHYIRATTISRASQLFLQWLDNTSTSIGSPIGGPITTSFVGSWNEGQLQVMSPINAAFATLTLYVYATGAANEQHYADIVTLRFLTLQPV